MKTLFTVLGMFATVLYGQQQALPKDSSQPARTIAVVPRNTSVVVTSKTLNSKEDNERYIGFNTSYLLQQILPFNAIPIQQNMYGITYRKYSDNRGYRISAGANVSELNEVQWFGLRIDRDRYKTINNHWRYFNGGGGGIEFFQDPDNIEFFVSTEINLVGQLHFGVEYNINQVMSLSLECQATLKLGSSSALVLRPPTVITAHFALN